MGGKTIVGIAISLLPIVVYWKAPKNEAAPSSHWLAKGVFRVVVDKALIVVVIRVRLEPLWVPCNAKISATIINLWLLRIKVKKAMCVDLV